jgi:hypothetical protein
MPASMTSTYPFEPSPPWTTVNPKPFLPFRTRCGSEELEAPPLPSPRNEPFNDNYIVSTHLVPAGCPRLTPDIPLPVVPKFKTNTAERKRDIQQLFTEIIERQERFVRGELGGERSEKPLWNCVNRYVKRVQDGRKGLTLFLAHANGFPKEVLFCLTQLVYSRTAVECVIDMGSNSAIFIIVTHSFTD